MSAIVSPTTSGAVIPKTSESRSIGFEPSYHSTAMSCLPQIDQLDRGMSTDHTQTSETLALPSDQPNAFDSVCSQKENVGSLVVPSTQNISMEGKDNCAICIEVLDDNDDVRGLTCGHCYHQKCIDPWLTNRRGACPLCKIGYYPQIQLETLLDEEVSSPQLSTHDPRPSQGMSNFASPLPPNGPFSILRDPPRAVISPPPSDFAEYTPTELGRGSRWMSTRPHFRLFRGERRRGTSERSPSRLEQGEL